MAIKMSLKNVREEDILDYVKYFYKGIRKFGFRKITQKIKELYLTSSDGQQEALKQAIFNKISLAFSIPIDAIKTSSKRGSVTESKAMAILLLHRHASISQAEIALIFGRGQSLVSRRIANFIKGNDKMYSGPEFIEIYNRIDAEIIQLKETWKNKQ